MFEDLQKAIDVFENLQNVYSDAGADERTHQQ